MYVHIFGYLVNKLEIWWVYLSPIEKNKKMRHPVKMASQLLKMTCQRLR